MSALIRLVMVEDSPTQSQFLRGLLRELGFDVVGSATTVAEAEEAVERVRPDLVLSDVRLGSGNGIELTRRLLARRGIPVVLITAYDPRSPSLVFEALEAGALEVLPKPPARTDPPFAGYCRELERTLRLLATTPVIRRVTRGAPAAPISGGGAGGSPALKGDDGSAGVPVSKPAPAAPIPGGGAGGSPALKGDDGSAGVPVSTPAGGPPLDAPLLAIGASTGGPPLIADIFRGLRGRRIGYAVVAQHIMAEFAESFRAWLADVSSRKVYLAHQAQQPEPGAIYVAPARCHLRLGADGSFRVVAADTLTHLHVPSVDELFGSIARVAPRDTLALLLTGMGTDGAAGLRALRDAGAWTVAQQPDTAVVDGMPRAAIERGAAREVLSPEQIQALLQRLPAG